MCLEIILPLAAHNGARWRALTSLLDRRHYSLLMLCLASRRSWAASIWFPSGIILSLVITVRLLNLPRQSSMLLRMSLLATRKASIVLPSILSFHNAFP